MKSADAGIDLLDEGLLKRNQCAALVGTHHPRVTNDVCCDDRRQSSPLTLHSSALEQCESPVNGNCDLDAEGNKPHGHRPDTEGRQMNAGLYDACHEQPG